MNREQVAVGLIMTPFVMLLAGLVFAGCKAAGWQITALLVAGILFAAACIAGGISMLERDRRL